VVIVGEGAPHIAFDGDVGIVGSDRAIELLKAFGANETLRGRREGATA
jgi:hypothetical protein